MKNKRLISTPLFIIGLALGFVSFIGFLFWLIQRVTDGKGIDLYQSHWGISYSAIGILIFLAVTVIVVLISAYLSYRHKQVEKDFIEKYGK